MTETFANPLIFAVVVAVLGFVVFQVVLSVVLYIWYRERIRWQTRVILGVGVVVASAVAVLLHDAHVHAPGHQRELLEECLSRSECMDAFEEGVSKADD